MFIVPYVYSNMVDFSKLAVRDAMSRPVISDVTPIIRVFRDMEV